jgi:5-methylcytosine-specific restriction protein A
MRAPKHCGHNDCMTLVVGKTYCPEDTGWKTSPRTASSRRTGTRAWQQQRAKILQRDNHLCQIRGPRCTHTATEVNHLLPVYLA